MGFVDLHCHLLWATDVHQAKSGAKLLAAGIPALRKVVGEDALRVLLDHNPRRVLRGLPLA